MRFYLHVLPSHLRDLGLRSDFESPDLDRPGRDREAAGNASNENRCLGWPRSSLRKNPGCNWSLDARRTSLSSGEMKHWNDNRSERPALCIHCAGSLLVPLFSPATSSWLALDRRKPKGETTLSRARGIFTKSMQPSNSATVWARCLIATFAERQECAGPSHGPSRTRGAAPAPLALSPRDHHEISIRESILTRASADGYHGPQAPGHLGAEASCCG